MAETVFWEGLGGPAIGNQVVVARHSKKTKRKSNLSKEGAAKRVKVDKLELSKSPLQYLNTFLATVPSFTVEHVDGPIHDPVFSAVVEIDGKVFKGFGRNKQHAKQVTALEALKVLLNDDTLTYDGGERPLPERVEDQEKPACLEATTSLAVKIEDNSKTPVQILNELDSTAVFDLVKEDCTLLSHRYWFSRQSFRSQNGWNSL